MRGFRPATQQSDVPAFNTLSQPYLDLLWSLYRGESQIGLDEQPHQIETLSGVTQSQGMWIYDLCLKVQPKATLEIGMACGFSTLYFLAAAARTGAAHTAIDAFQLTHWHGIALRNARQAGAQVEFIEELSFRAAVKLAEANRLFDVIFIDGAHHFDDVLVDFTLLAPVCRVGGYVILDDLWMRGIKTAAAFIEKNRLDFEAVRTPIDRIALFRKVGEDQRNWDHFELFAVAR